MRFCVKFKMDQDGKNAKIIIFPTSEITRTFLFESAKMLASKGRSIYYISCKIQDSLPMGSDKNADVYVFSRIKFMTIPKLRDLLHFLYKLHKCLRIPEVIIVENVEQYCRVTNRGNININDLKVLCASLKDTFNYITQFHTCNTRLILSLDYFKQYCHQIAKTVLSPEKMWYISGVKYNRFSKLKWKVVSANNVSAIIDGTTAEICEIPDGNLIFKLDGNDFLYFLSSS